LGAALTEWQIRTIGEDILPASDFLANERNWRIHPKPQQGATEGSLSEVGWVQRVLVNKRTSPEWGADQGIETLVDGHLRITLALRKGDDTPVPVEFVDLTPHEEALILATLDPIAEMAATDRDKLEELLRDVNTGEAALQEMLAELAEKAGIDYTAEPPEDFSEYGEDIDTEYKCPKCNYEWSGKPK